MTSRTIKQKQNGNESFSFGGIDLINWPTDIETIVTCDLETTGVDVMRCCWITGSFGLLDAKTLETIDELELTSRPNHWDEEARYIHRISKQTADKFPERSESLERLLNFLPPKGTFAFACHASASHKSSTQNWQKVFAHFDFAILKWDFVCQDRWFDFHKYFSDELVISSTEICRQHFGVDKKLNLKESCEQLGIPMVGEHHNAKDDRLACESILRKYKNETTLFNVRERGSKLDSPISEIQENSSVEEQQRFGL